VGVVGVTGNRLLQLAVAVEVVMLIAFLALPPLPDLLGASLPGATGWLLALIAVPAVWAADTADKWRRQTFGAASPRR
jgi:hypothetical protein